jgi:Bacteriodetes cell division protein (FtsL-like)
MKVFGNKKNKVTSLIRYQWMLKHLPYFLFLAFLAVIYIYNGHYADRIVRDIGTTGRELQEMQYEFKSLKSEVMFRSKQSELAKAVGPFGLKPLSSPPLVLSDSVNK